MERYNDLLFSVWREACRHIEIQESLARIASLLRRSIPVDTVAVVAFEGAGSHARRVCYLSMVGQASPPPSLSLDLTETRVLSAWCETGRATQYAMETPSDGLPRGILDGLGTHMLAVPLISDHGARGVFLLGNDRRAYHEREVALADILREPLAVAVENDRRLHELMTLREAAEADKRKLLHRLGREQLLDEIVGADRGLEAVMERVALVSRSDVPVLILGETGSGKEVIARAIHEGSLHADGPFIRVNCGAIPPELIDSELFGHERGSFTGATASRRGWFERADGGTLFLDEIGELPTAAQVRLLRVLQDGTFERVGGEKPLQVTVRVVTATHRDLARMVQEHTFRADLWYRIAVFPIVLPPLRERKQDIPAFARHFAARAARRFGLRPQAPTPGDIALLCEYDWPGNVRELSSVVDRAAILGDGDRLEIAKALGIAPVTHGPAMQARGADRTEVSDLPTLDAAMRTHIERALAVCRGRIEGNHGAAQRLSINPHTLRARMRKLGVDWRQYRE